MDEEEEEEEVYIFLRRSCADSENVLVSLSLTFPSLKYVYSVWVASFDTSSTLQQGEIHDHI